MRIGKFILGACLALSATTSTQAGTATWNSWSGGSFPAASGSDLSASLAIDNSGSMYGGGYGNFFYTGAADADLVVSSALESDGVSGLALSIIQAGNTFLQQPVLSIGGQTYGFDSQTVVDAGTVEGFAANLFTFSWDISGFGAGTQYEIRWAVPAHVAFSEISTTQIVTANAVPEPSACALMLAGLAGVAAMARRARR